jgi:hypothetical protein
VDACRLDYVYKDIPSLDFVPPSLSKLDRRKDRDEKLHPCVVQRRRYIEQDEKIPASMC